MTLARRNIYMGCWGFLPFENDTAGDWYFKFMEKTNIREEWLKGINHNDRDVARAAVGLFIAFGHEWIWSSGEEYDNDLALSISKAKDILEQESSRTNLIYSQGVPEILQLMTLELLELETRRTNSQNRELFQDIKLW